MATGLAALSLAGAAAADPMNPATPEDGLWYYYQAHLDEIHASGITGKGVTIAIIDSPINLEVPTLQGANIEVKDSFCRDASGAPMPGTSTNWDLASHGTEVVSLMVGTGAGYPGGIGVKGVAPDSTVLFYPHYTEFDFTGDQQGCHDEAGKFRQSPDALAIEDAVANGAQIISMSFGGSPTPRLEEAIATALRHGVILVAALPNKVDSSSSSDGAPATNNGVVSVLSIASDGSLQSTLSDPASANTSEYVDVVAPGVNILGQGGPTTKDWTRQAFTEGTSYATPIVAGELALDMQKYPDATPNQILQSLVHNTGSSGVSHDLAWDATYGYGAVSPRSLLATDPTQYKDVNPFIDPSITNDDLNGPSVAEIASTTTATPAPGVTPTDPGTSITGSSTLAPLLVVGGLVLLLIIAVIVIAVIVAARGKRKGPGHG
jgi:subtilisin family serine protease